MSTQRKRNRFLSASPSHAAFRRGAKAVEARHENCETVLR
jgi:hypothetical protein